MKLANQVVLFSSLVCLGLSANAYGSPQSAQGDISEDSPTISKPRHPIPAPNPGTEYSMRMVKPSPHIDYKIVFVTPDPSINYTIRNVRPELNNPFMWGYSRHNGFARKSCPRK